MPKLLKYLICGVALFCIGCILVHEQMNRSANLRKQAPTPSVAEYIVPASEMLSLQTNARNGDCAAAYRIGMHHFFYTLQFDDATVWFRMAAKCPNVRYKAALVAALLTQTDEPKVAAEVDSVILEMKKIDPEDVNTKRAEVEVMRRRQTSTVQR